MIPWWVILSDFQLSIDPNTGRPQIHLELFHEMRQYLMIHDVTERKARELRVQKQVHDLENDTLGQRKYLLLEAEPRRNMEVDKGKGIALEENEQEHSSARFLTTTSAEGNGQNKLMAAAINAYQNLEVKDIEVEVPGNELAKFMSVIGRT